MADFLNQAKNILSGRGPNQDKPIPADNRIDRIDQCKLVWYQWANELTTSNAAFELPSLSSFSPNDSKLAEARSYDISNHIESFTYSKDKNSGAGSFQFVLHNSFDWARFMRPGQWIVAMMTGDGDLPMPQERPGKSSKEIGSLAGVQNFVGNLLSSIAPGLAPFTDVPQLPLPDGPSPEAMATYKPKMRCIGVIQRVGVRSSTSIDGAVETTFTITGKDFGVVYEDTELWFNANNADGETFQAALKGIVQQFSRNLTDLLGKWHDIFINPTSVISKKLTNVNAFFPQQWILPDRMVRDLGLPIKQGGAGYFGDIANLKEFQATIFESPDPNLLSGLQGRCWDRLKNCSQPEFHELFTELSDAGNPKLYFRPIPWAMDKSGYPTLGKLMLSYADLASGQEVLPPAPVGTIVSTLSSLAGLDNLTKMTGGGGSDLRTFHSVNMNATEVESYDIGPDYHSRANFFLVDVMRSTLDQKNSFSLLSKGATAKPFPFRDENDIKRHGFRPLFIQLQTFNIGSKGNLFSGTPYGNSPTAAFMLECNEVLKDFYANAEDFYTGTMNLTAGKSGVKLGKVVLTDSSFQGISDMIFYIEGYTDTFSVNGDGTGSWTQAVNVARGISKDVLNGGSTKDKAAVDVGTFHVDNSDGQQEDSSVLGKMKNFLK